MWKTSFMFSFHFSWQLLFNNRKIQFSSWVLLNNRHCMVSSMVCFLHICISLMQCFIRGWLANTAQEESCKVYTDLQKHLNVLLLCAFGVFQDFSSSLKQACFWNATIISATILEKSLYLLPKKLFTNLI